VAASTKGTSGTSRHSYAESAIAGNDTARDSSSSRIQVDSQSLIAIPSLPRRNKNPTSTNGQPRAGNSSQVGNGTKRGRKTELNRAAAGEDGNVEMERLVTNPMFN